MAIEDQIAAVATVLENYLQPRFRDHRPVTDYKALATEVLAVAEKVERKTSATRHMPMTLGARVRIASANYAWTGREGHIAALNGLAALVNVGTDPEGRDRWDQQWVLKADLEVL